MNNACIHNLVIDVIIFKGNDIQWRRGDLIIQIKNKKGLIDYKYTIVLYSPFIIGNFCIGQILRNLPVMLHYTEK